MAQALKKTLDTNAFYFIPLGGSEEFGVNLNVYAADGQYLAVDCGLGFADERYPGIDLLLPDPAFLEKNKKALKGLIITHAHEDHIGAVAHLWPRLKCPLYASPFTAVILAHKLREAGLQEAPVRVVKPLQTIEIGDFSVRFIPVAHSVPDSCALAIETRYGRVLHSADWNLDPRPVLGKPVDPEHFKEEGNKGVLAYIGDSTNAEVAGRAGSESDIEFGMEQEFRKCKGRIAVTMFSSNISRMITIARAAKKCGRDVGVIGRSLHRMVGAARDCNMLKGIPDFLSEEDLGYLPDQKALMIVTGSQGEYQAALSKIARGDHPSVTLKRGDTVIFSARSIPGNEVNINGVRNNLCAAGVRVVTPSDTQNIIHVSGHPCRDEIAEMYQWVRPKVVIPVHGERVQLEAQAAFARECQVPEAIVPSNGAVIRLAPGRAEIVDHVSVGMLAVDQKRLISSTHASIGARRKLQFSGVVHVSLVLDARGALLGEPKINTVGLIDENAPGEEKIIDQLYDEVFDLLDELTFEERLDDHFVSEELRIGVRRFIVHVLGLKPQTTVHVIRV